MGEQMVLGERAVPAPRVAWSADMVRERLTRRWPDGDYLHIAEAPQDSSRQGRKIDVLVIALWQSRGLERDAVEVKVSLLDWKRERDLAEKADFWWRHSHRFWVAVPDAIAGKVREDLPAGWGLLSCSVEGAPKVVVKAARREAEPLSWFSTVGLLRAAADCGTSALLRAEQRGRQKGQEEGRQKAERGTSDEALRSLRDRVQRFEEASGLRLGDEYSAGELGSLVALVRREAYSPGWLADSVDRSADSAIAAAERLTADAKSARQKARAISEAVRLALTPHPVSPVVPPPQQGTAQQEK